MWDILFGTKPSGGWVGDAPLSDETQMLRLIVFVGISIGLLLVFILRALHRLAEKR